MNLLKICLLGLIFVLGFLASVSNSFAFECGVSADPWYIIEYKIDQNSVPNGVKVRTSGESLYLSASSDLPIYIIEKADGLSFDGSEIPNGYRPISKITQTEIYNWGNNISNGKIGWTPTIKEETYGEPIEFNLDYNKYSNLYSFEAAYGQVYQDNRPDETLLDLPSPQKFQVPIYYMNRKFDLSGTAYYQINKQYNPNAYAESMEECKFSSNLWNENLNKDLNWWEKFLRWIDTIIM